MKSLEEVSKYRGIWVEAKIYLFEKNFGGSQVIEKFSGFSALVVFNYEEDFIPLYNKERKRFILNQRGLFAKDGYFFFKENTIKPGCCGNIVMGMFNLWEREEMNFKVRFLILEGIFIIGIGYLEKYANPKDFDFIDKEYYEL